MKTTACGLGGGGTRCGSDNYQSSIWDDITSKHRKPLEILPDTPENFPNNYRIIFNKSQYVENGVLHHYVLLDMSVLQKESLSFLKMKGNFFKKIQDGNEVPEPNRINAILIDVDALPAGAKEEIKILTEPVEGKYFVSRLESYVDLEPLANHLGKLISARCVPPVLNSSFCSTGNYFDSRVIEDLPNIYTAEQWSVLSGPIEHWQYINRKGIYTNIPVSKLVLPENLFNSKPVSDSNLTFISAMSLTEIQRGKIRDLTEPDRIIHMVSLEYPELLQGISPYKQYTIAQDALQQINYRDDDIPRIKALVLPLINIQAQREGIDRSEYVSKHKSLLRYKIPVTTVSIGCYVHDGAGDIISYSIQKPFSEEVISALPCRRNAYYGGLFTLPDQWTPGISVKVRWNRPIEGIDNWIEKNVAIEKYDIPKTATVHFFANDEVRLISSNKNQWR
ncbi:DUF3304 domain-containing protein [Glaciimonas soli]|uniref:DUF3304 domain-containing protein n=1 Tax=Glaciimonas soli TaxID=2590999 RepID=UPI0018859067|nr:DUF3304 domain-containing protein [Glaciimonas soli]